MSLNIENIIKNPLPDSIKNDYDFEEVDIGSLNIQFSKIQGMGLIENSNKLTQLMKDLETLQNKKTIITEELGNYEEKYLLLRQECNQQDYILKELMIFKDKKEQEVNAYVTFIKNNLMKNIENLKVKNNELLQQNESYIKTNAELNLINKNLVTKSDSLKYEIVKSSELINKLNSEIDILKRSEQHYKTQLNEMMHNEIDLKEKLDRLFSGEHNIDYILKMSSNTLASNLVSMIVFIISLIAMINYSPNIFVLKIAFAILTFISLINFILNIFKIKKLNKKLLVEKAELKQ